MPRLSMRGPFGVWGAAASQALMRPSPKFPTSRWPLNGPKPSAGAIANSHGALRSAPGGDARDERTGGVEFADVPEPRTGHLVLALCVLLRIRDEDVAPDALDPEGSEARGEHRVDERPRRHGGVELAVEDVDTRTWWKSAA